MKIKYRTTEDGIWQFEHALVGWIDERSIAPESRPWRAFVLTNPVHPDGSPAELPADEEFWSNSHYLVHRRVMASDNPDAPEGVHLSFRTVENDTRHDWREFQRIKNELCGPEWEAVELYPAVSRVVDTANQYHLWCINGTFPLGFTNRFVQDADVSAKTGAKQRPLSGAHQ